MTSNPRVNSILYAVWSCPVNARLHIRSSSWLYWDRFSNIARDKLNAPTYWLGIVYFYYYISMINIVIYHIKLLTHAYLKYDIIMILAIWISRNIKHKYVYEESVQFTIVSIFFINCLIIVMKLTKKYWIQINN